MVIWGIIYYCFNPIGWIHTHTRQDTCPFLGPIQRPLWNQIQHPAVTCSLSIIDITYLATYHIYIDV